MKRKSLSLAALIVVTGMLLGRFSGILREMVMAAALGLTRDADLAIFAISIPDFLTALLIGGAAGAVLIPEFHRLSGDEDPSAASQLVCHSLAGIGLASLLVCGVLAWGAPLVVRVLAPGFEEGTFETAVGLFRIVLLAFPVCVLTAITAAALQARGKVVMPALGTLTFNLVVIAAVLLLLAPGRVNLLGWGVIAAAVARFSGMFVNCWRCGLFRGGTMGLFRLSRLHRSLGIRYVQAIAAIGFSVSVPMTGQAFASGHEGGMAAFTYAFKLVEVPQGICAAVISMVFFPRLSQLVAEGRQADVQRLLTQATGIVFLLTLPAVVGFLGSAQPIVTKVFERGRFESGDVAAIVQLSQLAIAALPGAVLTQLMMTVFHAHQNTRFPMLVSLGMIFAQIAGCWFAGARFGVPGVMVAVVTGSWLYSLSLLAGLTVQHRISLVSLPQLRQIGLFALLAAGSGWISWLARKHTSDPLLQTIWAAAAAGLCLGIGLLMLRRKIILPVGKPASS